MTRLAWVLAALSAACGGSVPAHGVGRHHAADPVCREIASRCHAHDPGAGVRHDCHVLGHGGTAAACAARRDECLATCPAADAGAVAVTGDAGVVGAP